MPSKNFRKRTYDPDDAGNESGDEEERRLVLEEVKFLQKQRERKLGIPALPTVQVRTAGLLRSSEKAEGDGEKDELVLQDTFAQETAVTVEDPNMLKYVEQELAKKRGKKVDCGEKEDKDPMDELYAVPEHLKVRKRNSEESSTQWTTGIAEVQLPIEYKLRNIEETEAAKKLLQEKRFIEHPELYKDLAGELSGNGTKPSENNNADTGGRRLAATDEFMLERFRKRERNRVMRR
ncbi:hypothetical protein HPP92_013024 [Vanilla planifolia]|uniref:Hepatocellular carcinoma-associated antigen 59 n=1 Tax=Vanilla planifolia TaxID=51239 RepID=A0A835QY96_VANPL|nr:hypothetical protein HPP92_013024 [Vanilla planifolia]